VRHLRMLGLGLIAALALGGLVASSASAAKASEQAEFQAFANCPFHEFTAGGYEVAGCTWATSSYKERWASTKQKEEWEEAHGAPEGLKSDFTAGNVTVALKLPIELKGGFAENPEIEGTEGLEWVAAKGVATIQPVAQKGPSLKKAVDVADLSEAELSRFEYATKVAKQTTTTATVELAGPASGIHLNLANLLEGEGTAFRFPVKVKLSNSFVGPDCYVGSDENPIVVNFTTGTSGSLKGKLGVLAFSPEGTLLTVWGDTLVASGFASPGVENCGVEGGADEAMDAALGLPSSENTSVLNGVLKQAGAEVVEEKLG
jgi:hypothetical protein